MTDIFQSQGQQPTSVTQGVQDGTADLLKTVLNERGEPKYTSVEEAFKGLSHAQQYIPQLKAELTTKEAEIQQLREELAKRSTLDEVVSRLTPTQQQQPQVTPSGGIDEQSVEALIASKLSAFEQQKAQQTNRDYVNAQLVSVYGDKAYEVVAAKAAELGLTPEEIGSMAATKPKAVLSWFTSSSQKPTQALTTSSVNTINLQQAPVQPVGRPEKSLLSGATMQEQIEYMRKIRAEVLAKYGQ